MRLPETHMYTEKRIKRLEGQDLDRIVGLALGHYEGEGHWEWPHLDTTRDEAAPYSTHPRYVEYLLVSGRDLEVPVGTSGMMYDGISVAPYYWGPEWKAGPMGPDGMWSLAYGNTPMLALSRGVAVIWKRGALPAR